MKIIEGGRMLGVLVVASVFAISLPGCVNTPFSTAASMRVEVEVYKGPLSKEPELQWADLVALLEEADQALEILDGTAVYVGTLEREKRAWYVVQAIRKDIAASRGLLSDERVNAEAWTREAFPSLLTADPLEEDFESAEADTSAERDPCLLNCAVTHCELSSKDGPVVSANDNVRAKLDACVKVKLDYKFLIQQELRALEGFFGLREDTKAFHELAERRLVCRRKLAETDRSLLQAMRALSKLKGDAFEKEVGRAKNRLSQLINEDKAAKNARPEGRQMTREEVLRRDMRSILLGISDAAQRFKLKTSLWSEANVPYALESEEARRLQITFTALLGTYSDRMGSKADSLMKQMGGDDRLELPLSVSLRETNPPAYLRQFIWYDAGGDSVMHELGKHRDTIARERVRGVERLYADENWSNINTVYASGQGTVRMALIKDDIGNWNLKSFDADPSKVLDAYKNVALAGVDVATKLAKKVALPGGAGAAAEALDIANKFVLGVAGGSGASVDSKGLEQLHSETAGRLRVLQEDTKNEAATLSTKIADLAAKTKDGEAGQKSSLAYKKASTDAVVETGAAEKATLGLEKKTELESQVQGMVDQASKAVKEGESSAALTSMKEKLGSIKADIAKLEAEKTAAETKANTAKGTMKANESAAKEFDKNVADLQEARLALTNLPSRAAEKSKAILDGHQRVIDAVESSLVPSKQGGALDTVLKKNGK